MKSLLIPIVLGFAVAGLASGQQYAVDPATLAEETTPMVAVDPGPPAAGVPVAAKRVPLPDPLQGGCVRIARTLAEAVEARPSEVLGAVRRAMMENEACACEIVKTAITASHADGARTGEIVQTAVALAPARLREIVECAVAVRPEAKDEIRKAVESVFGGGKGGKGGKGVVVQAKPAAAPPGGSMVERALLPTMYPSGGISLLVNFYPPDGPPPEDPPAKPPGGASSRKRPFSPNPQPPATPTNPVPAS